MTTTRLSSRGPNPWSTRTAGGGDGIPLEIASGPRPPVVVPIAASRLAIAAEHRADRKRHVSCSTNGPRPVRRPAKIARLLALAHHIEAAIEGGEYKDRADAARQLGVTRARISQIMDLALLAPDIQEAILFMEAVDGVEPVRERGMRGILGDGDWEGQRGRWGELRSSATAS